MGISNFFHALLQKKTGSTTQLPVVEPADILVDRAVEGQTKLPEDLESGAGAQQKIVKQMEPSSGHIRSWKKIGGGTRNRSPKISEHKSDNSSDHIIAVVPKCDWRIVFSY